MGLEEELGIYTFLPWVKSGLGAHIVDDAQSLTSPRTNLNIQINIKRYTLEGVIDSVAAPKRTVELMGPGDVVGINRSFIVRRDPEPNSRNVENNYFALIESNQPDFFWRFTPVKTSDDSPNKLTPWISLIILTRDEFEGPHNGIILPEITINDPSKSLPDLSQAWAWAHCQIIGEVEDKEDLQEILSNEPYHVISRLLAPRHLEPNKKYYAFLLPSFEAGRLASLGLDVPDDLKGIDFAWDHQSTTSVPIGFYDTWEFETGEEGDFESLVEALVPCVLDENVGIRDLSITEHGFKGIPFISNPISLGGALLSPAANAVRKQIDVRTYEVTNTEPDVHRTEEIRNFIGELKRFLDIDELYKWNFVENDILVDNNILTDDDPIISLPKYGRWHAAKSLITRISDDVEIPEWFSELNLPNNVTREFRDDPPYQWFEELNLDPANRVSAGLGTRVMQVIQEEIMEAAWDQAGEIKKANDKLKWAQLSRTLSNNLYDKVFKILDQDELISIISPLNKKLYIQEENKTLDMLFQDSPIPKVFLEPSFKKITRRRGKTHRKIYEPTSNMHQTILGNFNSNPSNPNPNPITPENLLTFDNSFPNSSIKEENFSEEGFLNPSLIKKLLIKLTQFCCRHSSLYLICFILRLILKYFFKYDEVKNYDEAQINEFTKTAIQIEQGIPSVDATVVERVGEIIQLEQIYNKVVESINPQRTIEKKIQLEVKRPLRLLEEEKDFLEPDILAYFKIKRPMYEPLVDLSEELLLPGVGEIDDNIISILQTNPVFINSFMGGINDAIACECLWREYQTDLRGSFSRQFWDPTIAVERDRLEKLTRLRVRDPYIQTLPYEIEEEIREKYRDIDEIHKWYDKHLDVLKGDTSENRTVLIIKGELFRRYPRTIVYAVHGIVHTTDDGENIPVIPTIRDPNSEELIYLYPDEAANPEIKHPIFKGSIGSDITFFGFEILPQDIVGNVDDLQSREDAGWFFILQDPPSEARFGADIGDDPVDIKDWDDVCWGHFGLTDSKYIDIGKDDAISDEENESIKLNGAFLYAPDVRWNTHAGNQAFITLQLPVRIARHGSEMYPMDLVNT